MLPVTRQVTNFEAENFLDSGEGASAERWVYVGKVFSTRPFPSHHFFVVVYPLLGFWRKPWLGNSFVHPPWGCRFLACCYGTSSEKLAMVVNKMDGTSSPPKTDKRLKPDEQPPWPRYTTNTMAGTLVDAIVLQWLVQWLIDAMV